MLGLCTKHCTIFILIAMALTIGLQRVPAPLHIPAGGWGCEEQWFGVPFGYVSDIITECLGAVEQFLNYFVNGLLNVLIFFFPLRLLHDRYWHRRPTS